MKKETKRERASRLKFEREFEERRFAVTGGFAVSRKLKPYLAADGGTVGFVRPNGEIIRLVVALEVADKGEANFRYIVSQAEMDKLGLTNLDYDRLEFEDVV